ncbi:hypothetical protein Xen7305DRAFT_00052870 [Xenococcus sp. PCC 7305]|uniref:hypothetical protein n=1 Tax=Xenococcus sp. PCC 7305 TaxID=102125 RepID=UPI0002AC9D4B|nr:hypothetical protein [Xenococcus sp. PCC 7305]ELS05541.1 hypothetical protein Xen7305DRAFT_00052870 [Xenococcus sp. PCC 7305]
MSEYLDLLQWLFYNSLIPLMPIPLVWLGAWIIGMDRDWLSILSNGQLCFYCTTMSAAAIRDITTKAPESSQFIGILIGGIIFCMILATFAYGVAATVRQIDDNELSTGHRLAWTSIFAAISTTILVASSRKVLGLL